MNFGRNSIIFLSTGGYVGYIPKIPGTAGSLWGLMIAYGFTRISFFSTMICLSVFFFFSIWIAGKTEQYLQKKDPGCIVIDEMLGVVIGLAGLPFGVYTAISGFILFRFFDILKPFPVRWFEKRFAGGWGIVLDDVAAGIYTQIVLRSSLFAIGFVNYS